MDPGKVTATTVAVVLWVMTSTRTSVAADGPATEASPTGQVSDREATGLFSKSILISATRCLLAYVIFPFVAPAIGVASGVEGVVGLVVGVVAIVANIFSIRRFHAADHKWKIPITILNLAVIGLLVVLLAEDVQSLIG